MTKILLSLLISLVIGCGEAHAQVIAPISNWPTDTDSLRLDSLVKAWNESQSVVFTLEQSPHAKEFTDTVPCIMLVSDTAMHRSPAFSLNGFAIRRHYWPYHPDYAVINEQMEIDVTDYLDERHRRIRYFVWISKNLKP